MNKKIPMTCFDCGKTVSTHELEPDMIIRAVVMCPECYAKENSVDASTGNPPPKPSEPIELERLSEILFDNFYGHGLSKEIETAKAKVLEWVKSLVLNDVIGADESYEDGTLAGRSMHKTDVRNAHRAELRTKLKDILTILERER